MGPGRSDEEAYDAQGKGHADHGYAVDILALVLGVWSVFVVIIFIYVRAVAASGVIRG